MAAVEDVCLAHAGDVMVAMGLEAQYVALVIAALEVSPTFKASVVGQVINTCRGEPHGDTAHPKHDALCMKVDRVVMDTKSMKAFDHKYKHYGKGTSTFHQEGSVWCHNVAVAVALQHEGPLAMWRGLIHDCGKDKKTTETFTVGTEKWVRWPAHETTGFFRVRAIVAEVVAAEKTDAVFGTDDAEELEFLATSTQLHMLTHLLGGTTDFVLKNSALHIFDAFLDLTRPSERTHQRIRDMLDLCRADILGCLTDDYAQQLDASEELPETSFPSPTMTLQEIVSEARVPGIVVFAPADFDMGTRPVIDYKVEMTEFLEERMAMNDDSLIRVLNARHRNKSLRTLEDVVAMYARRGIGKVAKADLLRYSGKAEDGEESKGEETTFLQRCVAHKDRKGVQALLADLVPQDKIVQRMHEKLSTLYARGKRAIHVVGYPKSLKPSWPTGFVGVILWPDAHIGYTPVKSVHTAGKRALRTMINGMAKNPWLSMADTTEARHYAERLASCHVADVWMPSLDATPLHAHLQTGIEEEGFEGMCAKLASCHANYEVKEVGSADGHTMYFLVYGHHARPDTTDVRFRSAHVDSRGALFTVRDEDSVLVHFGTSLYKGADTSCMDVENRSGIPDLNVLYHNGGKGLEACLFEAYDKEDGQMVVLRCTQAGTPEGVVMASAQDVYSKALQTALNVPGLVLLVGTKGAPIAGDDMHASIANALEMELTADRADVPSIPRTLPEFSAGWKLRFGKFLPFIRKAARRERNNVHIVFEVQTSFAHAEVAMFLPANVEKPPRRVSSLGFRGGVSLSTVPDDVVPAAAGAPPAVLPTVLPHWVPASQVRCAIHVPEVTLFHGISELRRLLIRRLVRGGSTSLEGFIVLDPRGGNLVKIKSPLFFVLHKFKKYYNKSDPGLFAFMRSAFELAGATWPFGDDTHTTTCLQLIDAAMRTLPLVSLGMFNEVVQRERHSNMLEMLPDMCQEIVARIRRAAAELRLKEGDALNDVAFIGRPDATKRYVTAKLLRPLLLGKIDAVNGHTVYTNILKDFCFHARNVYRLHVREEEASVRKPVYETLFKCAVDAVQTVFDVRVSEETAAFALVEAYIKEDNMI